MTLVAPNLGMPWPTETLPPTKPAAEEPAPNSDKYPPGVRVVTVEAWTDMMRRRGVLSEDSNSARQQWKRLHDNLSYKDQIAEYDGLIWSVTGSVTA